MVVVRSGVLSTLLLRLIKAEKAKVLTDRILYFAVSGRRLVLLHGFTKKTQKTPAAEIETALRRMADFQGRGE